MRKYLSVMFILGALALLGSITSANFIGMTGATPPPGTFAPRVWLPVVQGGDIQPTPSRRCDAFGETYDLGEHVSPDGVGEDQPFECHWAYFFSHHWRIDPNRISTFHWNISSKCDQSWVRFAPSAEDPDRFRAYPKGYNLVAFAIGDGDKWIAGWDKDLPIDPGRFGGYVAIRVSDPCW